jgi:hypothetical protein
VPWSNAAELAEIFHLVQRDGVACEMQPAVEEHTAVASGENEAVAVQPAGLVGIETQSAAEEDGPDVGGAEREAEMAGFAFRDGVHGQAAACIAGCDFKGRGV